MFNARDSLIQVVIDNYDASIWSLNGLKSAHVLTILICHSTFKPYLETVQEIKWNAGVLGHFLPYEGWIEPEPGLMSYVLYKTCPGVVSIPRPSTLSPTC